MEVFIAPIISAIFSAVISACGVYVAITNRLTKTETMIEQLRLDVERHNHMVERTYALEARVSTLEGINDGR